MDNLTYWERRKAQQMYEYMRAAEETAAELEEVYRKAAHHIQKEAKKVFEKYQTRYDLTRKEAEILLKQMKSPEDIREMKRLLKLDPKNEELLKELESQSYGFRLNNLSNLYGQLDAIVLPMIAAERQKTMRLYEKLAEEAYYQSVFDIQQYAGYGFDFKALDAKNIRKVLSTRWLGKNFSQRIWDNTHDLAAAVKKELLINLLTGRPLKKAQDAIMEKFEAGAGDARRLVRTESCYICNQLHLQGYEACGVKKYIYLAILDLKTSVTCRNLDKKRFPVAEAQVGKNYPPMHPWCRSTTLADMPDALLKKLKQSAIDPATGKRITVPGDMTYKEWYEKYVKGKRAEDKNEKIGKTLENSSENDIIDMKKTSGAYDNINDPNGEKRDQHAHKYYASLRNSDKNQIVQTISSNTHIDKEIVTKMFDHLLVNKYELYKGHVNFDPDYNIAESIRRLREGKDIQKHDLILVHHEAMEHDLMKTKKVTYEEAHKMTEEKYNYREALNKWLDKSK